MWPFKKRESRATIEEILIGAGALTNAVSTDQALNIPALTACVELISMTVASMPIKLFKEVDETTETIDKDPRIAFLNDDSGDLLDGFQWKRAMVADYLLCGGGYSYIRRVGNNTKSLHYVDNQSVGINKTTDPIYKKAEIHVNGEPFKEWQFIKLLRKSKDGVTGKGIIKENNVMLSVAYNQMMYEQVLVKTGGNKKGFLKSQGRLSKEAMDELKLGWKNLYANNDENVLVLNNGLDFVEASQTSVELQLDEHKRTNANQICQMFLVPPRVLSGEAGEEEYHNWIKTCILPILAAFEAALNKDLLLPSEKEKLFFAFDTAELEKGNIKERYEAYELGIKNGVLQIDEARFKENLPPLGLKFLKLGLQDVLYFADTEEIYTPNTNKLAKMGENPTVDAEATGGVPNNGLDKGLPDSPRPSEDANKQAVDTSKAE